VTPELGLVVLAVIFIVGVAGLAVTAIALLPGAMVAESTLDELLRRRRRRSQGDGET
jgi:hypothetical protein